MLPKANVQSGYLGFYRVDWACYPNLFLARFKNAAAWHVHRGVGVAQVAHGLFRT